MTDLVHDFGTDLAFGPTGDLALSTGADAGRQRVLRRLLTNAGDYVWQLDYGASLASFVGQPAAALRIAAVVRAQIFREAAVSRSPEPVIETNEAGPAALALTIRYADGARDISGAAGSTLNLTVGGV